jgi:hypothetical protein
MVSSALPAYDAVFTARHANIEDFRSCGVRNIHYLPFAYDPDVHRPWPENMPAGAPSDVLFVGGCDGDRLPLISAIIDAGLDVALFGGYWNRHSKTRSHWRGIADQDTIRAASAATRVCLCLVRRANRDGHVMRSFEAAAIGGCIWPKIPLTIGNSSVRKTKRCGTFRRLQLSTAGEDPVADAGRASASRPSCARGSGRNTYVDRLAAMLRLVERGENAYEI